MKRERIAYICTHKECVPPRRVFVDDDSEAPRCHGKMTRQANARYAPGGTKPKMIGVKGER